MILLSYIKCFTLFILSLFVGDGFLETLVMKTYTLVSNSSFLDLLLSFLYFGIKLMSLSSKDIDVCCKLNKSIID